MHVRPVAGRSNRARARQIAAHWPRSARKRAREAPPGARGECAASAKTIAPNNLGLPDTSRRRAQCPHPGRARARSGTAWRARASHPATMSASLISVSIALIACPYRAGLRMAAASRRDARRCRPGSRCFLRDRARQCPPLAHRERQGHGCRSNRPQRHPTPTKGARRRHPVARQSPPVRRPRSR